MRITQNILIFSISLFHLLFHVHSEIINLFSPSSSSSSAHLDKNYNNGNNQIYSLTYFSVDRLQDNLIICELQSLNGNRHQGAFEKVIQFLEINQNNIGNQKKQYNESNELQNNQQNWKKQSYVQDQPIKIMDKKNIQLFPLENLNGNQKQTIKTSLLSINSFAEVTNQKDNTGQVSIKSSQNDSMLNKSQQIDKDPEKILYQFLGYDRYYIVVPLSPYNQIYPDYQSKIVSREFANLGLYNQIPKTFIDGQIYQFSGVVTDITLVQQKKERVNIVLLGKNSKQQILCTSEELTGVQFNLSCQMRGQGRYYLYVFIGSSGNYSSIERKIISNQNIIKSTYLQAYQPEPKGLRIQLINNNLYALWDSRASLTNLTVYQETDGVINKKEYFLSNKHQKFKIPFKDFENFLNKTTYIQISHAKSMDNSMSIIFTKFTSTKDRISFEALDHAFDVTQSKVTMEPELPWRLQIDQKFKFNLTVSEDIKSTIFITQPDSKLRKIQVITQKMQKSTNTSIAAGTRLSLQISFSKPGTHIIEVNNAFGIAVINRPIYVGAGYPLIPDFKDMSPKFSLASSNMLLTQLYQKYYLRTTQQLKIKEPDRNSSQEKKREYLLALLNGLRKKFRLSTLYLDQALNIIAQNHSDDMVLRNFFGHLNPDGQRSYDRAKKFNFRYSVGENLAQTKYLIENHLSLQRSAAHLQNTINKLWVRVGIGINITKTQRYTVTYLFSVRDLVKQPISKEEEVRIRSDLIKLIRQSNNNIFQENEQLSEDIKEWMLSNRTKSVVESLIKKRGFKPYLGFSFKMNYSEDWQETLRKGNIFKGYDKYSNYKQIGAAILFKPEEGGLMEIYFVFLRS